MMENRNHDGYEFVGWYVDEALTKRINPGGRLPRVMTLYDKWVPVWYPVEYNLHGGENDARNPRLISVESDAITLHPAKKNGKIFAGWYWNSKKVTTLPQRVHTRVVLDALFKNPFRVYLESNGGEFLEPLYTNEQGLLPGLPTPKRKGYRFCGWYSDFDLKSPFDPNTILRRDMRLYASWQPQEHAIFYDVQDGMNARRNPKTYIPGQETTLYPAAKKGCRFEGWMNEEGNIFQNIPKSANTDLHLKAVFSKL
jgi:uncharacterized repeat protein (TIGR02543 family)